MQGISAADRFIAVDSQIADFLDGEDLGEEAGFKVVAEGRFVDQGSQVVGVGFFEIGVVGVEPSPESGGHGSNWSAERC